MTVWTIVRYIQLLLVLATFSVAFARFDNWSCRHRSCWMPVVSILALTLAIGYAAVETLVEHAPGGARTIIYAIALVVPLLYLPSVNHRPPCERGAKPTEVASSPGR